MNITTRINRQPVRTTVAFAMGAAVLLAASACGTEQAAVKAPASIKQAVPSDDSSLPADVEECLVEQAKVPGATLRCWELAQPDDDEPQLLAPNGRPVPLPGGNG
jgi:hypothetical protein